MAWSGIHDGCPLHGNAIDTQKGAKIGCLCNRLGNLKAFSCPECGGFKFGTDSRDDDNWIVCCHDDSGCRWSGPYKDHVINWHLL